MQNKKMLIAGLVLGTGAVFAFQPALNNGWKMHDRERPLPKKVTPAPMPEHDGSTAPSDAVVLFDGTSLDAWEAGDGSKAKWTLRDDKAVQIKPGTGILRTKESFGDCQLHIEWQIPGDQGHRTDQNRGNSGVYFMGRYELQVLSTYDNKTYADGMAGAVYGQNPPMVNPARPMGEWNSYDVIFRRPHFNEDGSVAKPATLTVFFNGVLVQDHFELVGPASHGRQSSYSAHEDKAQLHLQDHNEPTMFRNIWVRDLSE